MEQCHLPENPETETLFLFVKKRLANFLEMLKVS